MHWFLDPIFKNYDNYKGRATRQEFWMYMAWFLCLYTFFLMLPVVIFDDRQFLRILGYYFFFLLPFTLVILQPTLAISARRLHDLGKSAWWLLVVAVPSIGFFLLLMLCYPAGQKSANKYGPSPYEEVPIEDPTTSPPITPVV